jgi:hypothetical protein
MVINTAGTVVYTRQLAGNNCDADLREDAQWRATTTYSQNDVVAALAKPSGGFVFRAMNTGTTGATEPTWPLIFGNTVLDGSVTWQATDENWHANRTYAAGATVSPVSNPDFGFNFQTLGGGTTGSTEPHWPTNSNFTVVDGTVTWHPIGFWPGTFTGCTPMKLVSRALGGAETVLASEGDQADVGSTVDLSGWAEFVAMNTSGQVAFRGVINGFISDQDESSSAIFTAGPGAGSLNARGISNDVVSGVSICGFGAVVGINDAGDVIYDGYSFGKPVWQATHFYTAPNNVVVPTIPNGLVFTGTTGTSGGAEPSWPTNIGDTVPDGTVTWTATRPGNLTCDEDRHNIIRFSGAGQQVLFGIGTNVGGGVTVVGFGKDVLPAVGTRCNTCEYRDIDGFINSSGHASVAVSLSAPAGCTLGPPNPPCDTAAYLLKDPGSFTQVARTGGAGPGGVFGRIYARTALNNSDQVLFKAQVNVGGVFVDKLIRWTPPSTYAVIATVNDVVAGETFAALGSFGDINSSGHVVFQADLVVDGAVPQGYYFWDGATVTPIFVEPTAGGLAQEMVQLNDADTVAYTTGAGTQEGPEDQAELDEKGLFTWTKAGGSQKMIANGDNIVGIGIVSSVNAQHPSFRKRQMNSVGCVATQYYVGGITGGSTEDQAEGNGPRSEGVPPAGQLFVSCTAVCPTITLSPASLPSGTIGVPYSQTVMGVGGAAPYTFAITSGTQPTGTNLSAGGTLAGTPTATGPFTFTVTATDKNNCTGSQSYTVTINPCTGPAAPAISISTPTANIGQTVQLSWKATLGAGQGVYNVQKSVGAGPFFTIGSVAATAANPVIFSFKVSGPTGPQHYQVVAVPTCNPALGATSNVVDLTVSGQVLPPPCPPPAAPAGLSVTPSPAAPGALFTLSWSKVTGADHYEVFVSKDGGATFSFIGVVYGATTFSGTVSGNSGDTLTFAVQADAACGSSSSKTTVTLNVGPSCTAPNPVTNITVQAFDVTPPRAPSPTEYILVSWTPPATGTVPTRYAVRINGDPEVLVVGTSVVLPPRGTPDPITAFVTPFGCAALVSSETFDPNTGKWSTTQSLALPRQEHTATLLSDGKVVAAGGVPNLFTAPTPSSELFDPGAAKWSSTGPLSTARALAADAGLGGSAASSRSGERALSITAGSQVLVEGGVGPSGPLNSSELYDSTAGTWSPSGSMTDARNLHTATVLQDGRVLVAGGLGSAPLASAEIYDPASKAWTTTGSLATARYRHTATLLSSGKVLVAGGFGTAGALSSAELYDPTTGAWTTTGSLAAAREGHTATLLASGKVLAAGGDDGTTPLASAELFDPAAGTWSSTGNLLTARRDHTATLLASGNVLIVGGFGTDLTVSLKSTELYNPTLGTFSAGTTLQGAHGFHAATLLSSGGVLVAGAADALGTELPGPSSNTGPIALFLSPPVASFTISASPQVGIPVTFTDTSTPQATSWLWIFDEGTASDPDPSKRPTSTLQSPTHTYANAGDHQTTLVASNGAGSSTATQTFNVAPAGGAVRVLAGRTIAFDTSDPSRWRAKVALPGANSVFLHLTSGESTETIVFLRFLDASGRRVAERRLSVQPGIEAVYDLGAYGLRGAYSIELVSNQKFQSTLSVMGRQVREVHR